jgi:glycosyltransferase involved in cell wall biosynthesis
MSKPSQKILFLSHSASRNGATILLLHLLRWLKNRTDYQIEVMVNGRGEFLDEFRAIGPTRVWRSPAAALGLFPRAWRAALAPRLEAQFLRAVLRGRRYDLVHVNTVANWQHVPYLARRNRNLLWHVHEMSYAIRLLMKNEAWLQTFPKARRFVAVSNSVRDALVDEFKVPAGSIDLVHGFIPRLDLSPEAHAATRKRIHAELGLPEGAFVIGGCGGLGWRKGTDLFAQIARSLSRKSGSRPAAFLWVGGNRADKDTLEFLQDIRLLGLEPVCRWVPSCPNVLDYYCAMDVFALTSREDPFPLVMLEAGSAGLPTVCFEGSGGGPEFIDSGAGLAAPYLDVEAFSDRLGVLRNDPELRTRLGSEAARRVRDIYTVEHQAPMLLQSIERCLA